MMYTYCIGNAGIPGFTVLVGLRLFHALHEIVDGFQATLRQHAGDALFFQDDGIPNFGGVQGGFPSCKLGKHSEDDEQARQDSFSHVQAYWGFCKDRSCFRFLLFRIALILRTGFTFCSLSRSFIHGAKSFKVFMNSLRSFLRLGIAQTSFSFAET